MPRIKEFYTKMDGHLYVDYRPTLSIHSMNCRIREIYWAKRCKEVSYMGNAHNLIGSYRKQVLDSISCIKLVI